MRGLLLFFVVVFCTSLKLYSQTKIVWKFDCKARVIERVDNQEKRAIEGYALLIFDFDKSKIEIYPDSMILNIIGDIKYDTSKGFLIMEYSCRDRYNNSCKAYLMYSVQDGKAGAMKLEWEDRSILYLIEKQTQFK